MEHKNSSDISAKDLLAQLKANMEDTDTAEPTANDGKKKYHFRRGGKIPTPPTEEQILAEMPEEGDSGFVSPVPRSEIEDLDLDALMKKYLSEEDYERMTAKDNFLEEEDEFVRTLSSIELSEAENGEDGETSFSERAEENLAAPDTELYDHLSEGGKVCDVPELEERDEMSDTRQAPLRPMSEADRTLAYGLSSEVEDDEEEGGFISVRELLAAQTVSIPAPATDNEEQTAQAPTSEVTFVDGAPTSEVSLADQIARLKEEVVKEDEAAEAPVEETFTEAFSDEASPAELPREETAEKMTEDTYAYAEQLSFLEQIFAEEDEDAPRVEDASLVSPDKTMIAPAFDDTAEMPVMADRTVVVPTVSEDEEALDAESLIADEELSEASPFFTMDNTIPDEVGIAFDGEDIAFADEDDEDLIADEAFADETFESFEDETVEETVESTEETPIPDEKTMLFDRVYESGEALVPTEEEPAADELFDEEIRPDDDFNDKDIDLMIAFDMQEELDAIMGKESADEVRSRLDSLSEEEEKKVEPLPEVEPIKEFVSPAETKEILHNYKTEYGKSALKLCALAAVSLLLFFYENIGIFGGKLVDALNPEFYPVVHLMVGLQLLFFGFAILYRQVIRGAKALLERRPSCESYLPLLLLASVLFTVVSCFFPIGAPVISFHFPVSLCLLFEMLGQRLDLRREIMAFRIVSSRRTKFALEKLDIDDAELETKAFDRFLPKQPDIFRINKTSFVDGYFARTKRYPSLKQPLGAFLLGSLVAAVAGFLVGILTLGRWNEAVLLSYAAFAFSLPATVFFTYSLPAFKAAKIAYADGSAIVGESALDEYTSAASISFDDREVFPTSGVKLRSIKVFGSGRLDTVIYDMASVYSEIGGPLADVLKVATADIGCSDNMEILSLDTDGVEAVVDGVHIFLGKADYLRHNGYLPVSDPDDEEVEAGDTSILFLVRNDEVVAKVYVRYGIDPEFERTLKSLYRSGICVGIKTVDPNINDDMLSTRIRLSKYPVRVLKYTDVSDRSRGSDRTDSGIVSKKSVKALLRAFTLCDKIKHITKTNLLINALTVLVGVLLAIAASLIGSVSGIASIYVALFQLFWLIPVYLISKFLLL